MSLAADTQPAVACPFLENPLEIPSPRNRHSIEWVGDWRFCPSCSQATKDRGRGSCIVCIDARIAERKADQRKHEANRQSPKQRVGKSVRKVRNSRQVAENTHRPGGGRTILHRARPRPKGVVVLEQSEDSASWYALGYCVARVPDGTSPTHKVIAQQLAARSTSRLLSNDSLDFALGLVEGGRDKLARELQASGQNISRDQVAHSLRALESSGTISRSGQLKSHLRPERVWKKVSGALTYKIHVTFAVLGDLEGEAYTWMAKHTTPCATVGVTLRTRRIEGCLRHACETAQEGLRNHQTYWLSRRCIDMGLTEREAERIIRRFQRTVARVGHLFTSKEALKTMHSAYRYHG